MGPPAHGTVGAGGSAFGGDIMTKAETVILSKIKSDAFHQLSWRERQGTNLYIHGHVLDSGARVGPSGFDLILDRPTILVFADEEPLSGFGHPCRYFLYDAGSAALYREVKAQFPPLANESQLSAFHRPIVNVANQALSRVRASLRCPLFVPDGQRYAILFSGLSWTFNLNSLEFCYRTLVDKYGFLPTNIYVLHFDGTLGSGMGGPVGVWPGDGTAFRIQITGKGTRAAFQAVLNELKGKLRIDDLLLIHTENEAGNDGQSFLVSYDFAKYSAADFAADLAGLPRFKSLLALMASCYSGGFRDLILANSPAKDTSVACSTSAVGFTATTNDGNFSKFACDWISAQAGHDPYGAPQAFNADGDGDGVIEAEEAFSYAHSLRSPLDLANFGESSEAGGDISLAQSYRFWRWWCLLIFPLLEPYYHRWPDPEFYAVANRLIPHLKELVIPVVDRVTHEVSEDLKPRLEALLTAAFGS